jgi:hypothetical protein
MHSKRIFLTSFLTFLFFLAFAQEAPVHYAVCDWSFGFFNCEPTDIDQIRGSVATFSAENSDKGLTSVSFRGTTGIKYETLLLRQRISLGAGIRFSQFVQNTGKVDFAGGVNYFYFLYWQDEQNTYYSRLKSIRQTSNYLGIPAEFSFFPFTTQHFLRFYVKMGAEIDLLVSTHTNIHFMNEALPSVESQVASQISSPSLIGYSFYNCVGIKSGADGKPTFTVELLIPVLNTNPGSSGLLKNKFGAGVQINYHIPIHTRNR